MESGDTLRSYQRLLLPIETRAIERHLEAALGLPVAVEVAERGSTIVRVKPEGARLRVRVHGLFLFAPPTVLDGLVAYVRRPRDPAANAVLDAFIRGERARPAGGREGSLAMRGATHDLGAVFEALNRAHFEPPVAARIGWGRAARARPRVSILLGSYVRSPGAALGTIRVHPALDQDWVPRGFVELIVFHEMLHVAIPARCGGGRRAIHPPEFRRRERRFPGYTSWRRWERQHLGRLLGRSCAGVDAVQVPP